MAALRSSINRRPVRRPAVLQSCNPAADAWALADLRHEPEKLQFGGRHEIYGVELDVRIYGAELHIKSSLHLRRAQNLGASNDGAEQCKLGSSTPSLLVPS